MKGGKKPQGYTIVEVMVVLAISSVMFLVASTVVSGKQQRTAFTQGTNETASQLRGIADDVVHGKFSDAAVGCSVVGGVTPYLSINSSGATQGKNQDCTFLGKLLYFYDKTASGNPPADYETLTLVDPVLNPITNKPLDGNSLTYVAKARPLTLTAGIDQALEVKRMQVRPVGGVYADNYSFGFILGGGAFAAGTYASGAQSVALVYATNLVDPYKFNSEGGAGALQDTMFIQFAEAAKICLSDGENNANITIDTKVNGLNVSIEPLAQGSGLAVCT